MISRDFDELGLGQGRCHAQDGLVRKEDRPFRHRVHVAREMGCGEIIQQLRAEPAALRKPGKIGGGKMECLQIIERLLQARRHEKAPIRRKSPHEKLEHGRASLAVIEIGLHHGELVKVGQ